MHMILFNLIQSTCSIFVFKIIELFKTSILMVNFILLLLRLLLVKPNIIYLGDSHAYYLSQNSRPIKMFSINKSNILTIWVGPKLLYTIANEGFSLNTRMKMILKFVGNGQTIVLILGEIDCRVHFVKKTLVLDEEEFDNIALRYKKIVTQLITDYSLGKAIIIAPFPPSGFGKDNPRFPRNGSLSERILVTKKIAKSLVKISSDCFIVINNFRDLSYQNGSLNREYSDDGVHLNFLGSQIVQGEIKII